MAPTLGLETVYRVVVLPLSARKRQRASVPAVRPGVMPGRRGGSPSRLVLLLLAGLAAGLPGLGGAAEVPEPPGIWDVEEYPEGLSIHAQNGLTAVVRIRGIGVGGAEAPAEFAVGGVLANGTGFLAPLINLGPFQDSGKRLSLVFKRTNPTRLVGKILSGTGLVERQFTATKVFPVSGFQVLAFGDSITAGAGAEISGGYPDILQGLLAAKGLPLEVTNAGVGGETAFTGADRLPAILDASTIVPGIVLVLEGINGLGDDPDSIESTLDALLDMVATVRARGGLPVLGTLTPVRSPDTRGSAVIALNARIRQVAAQLGIRLADHHAAFGGDPGLLNADGLHPNDEGYQVMAETWRAAILAAW
jgi:acyl-CoA thioesterase-1